MEVINLGDCIPEKNYFFSIILYKSDSLNVC